MPWVMAYRKEGGSMDTPTRDSSATLTKYQLDKEFYSKVRATKSAHKRAESILIPPYNGRGFIVKQGQTFRVIDVEGAQVADVMFWNAHNKAEFLSLAR